MGPQYRCRAGGWSGAWRESGDRCSTEMGLLHHKKVVIHSTCSMATVMAHKQEKIKLVLLRDDFSGRLFWSGNEQGKC